MTRYPAISAIPPSTPMGRSTGRPKRARFVSVLDPLRNEASEILHLIAIPRRRQRRTCRSGLPCTGGTSRSGTAHQHPQSDHGPKGRVWFTARIRPAANPDFCRTGSNHLSAKVAPIGESARQLSMYDPKSGKWSLIDTCFTTQHLILPMTRTIPYGPARRAAERDRRLARHADV